MNKTLKAKFDELAEKHKNTSVSRSFNEPIVWFLNIDKSEPYEVNEEWYGIKKDGTFVWAYASGCSCWDGEYGTDSAPTIKAMSVALSDNDEIAEAFKKFLVNFEVQ